MAITFEFDSKDGVALGTVQGAISLEEMKTGAVSMWGMLAGRDPHILWDLRQATFNLSAEQVRELAEFIQGNAPPGDLCTAFVVEKDLEFGLVRMFSALRETDTARVAAFRDRESALSWIRREVG